MRLQLRLRADGHTAPVTRRAAPAHDRRQAQGSQRHVRVGQGRACSCEIFEGPQLKDSTLPLLPAMISRYGSTLIPRLLHSFLLLSNMSWKNSISAHAPGGGAAQQRPRRWQGSQGRTLAVCAGRGARRDGAVRVIDHAWPLFGDGVDLGRHGLARSAPACVEFDHHQAWMVKRSRCWPGHRSRYYMCILVRAPHTV